MVPTLRVRVSAGRQRRGHTSDVLVGAGSAPNVLDELVDDGLADGLAVRHEPGPECDANLGRPRRLVQHALVLAHGQLGLGIVEELNGQAVAKVHIGHVDREAGVGVLRASQPSRPIRNAKAGMEQRTMSARSLVFGNFQPKTFERIKCQSRVSFWIQT